MAKAVAQCNNKLSRVQFQAKARGGDNSEKITSMGILDANRGQPSNIPNTTFLLDSFRKKALVGQVNFD